MDKLKMHSPDLTQDNIAKIRELFPACVTETRKADGSLVFSVDFEYLKQTLSANIVEGMQERYQLNWPGKREALLKANLPIAKTLRPSVDESVHFDETRNLLIEGDNLEALKLLQEPYLGQIKAIYIDPPYNTGNDFIYTDIPQVACRLTSRSPDFARWTSVFRAERRLRSRKRLELGGSGREPAASFPGSDVFQRGGQTCRASFVEFWPISRLRA